VILADLLPLQVTPLVTLAFLAPERLLILLVIPLLVLAYIFASRMKNRRGMRFTNTSMLDVVVPKQSQWRRHLAVALSLLSLITLTAAFARPKTQVDVPRERATVVLVIDASLSMQATDVKPSRLDAAKEAAIDFVTALPEKYNVSVVSMAGSAAVLVPPTTAHNTVENAIRSIRLQDSTAIGEGIATALSALRQAPKDPDDPNSVAPGAIVLLTDGKNTTGRAPLQAAADAKAAKVPIYTIAYGTENGYVDLEGKREPVPVDHQAMRDIAAATGGRYFAAATAEELKSVYENIGSDVGYEKADREVTARFAGYGLAFAVLAALGAISLGAKWP
jgi:Ca-activated chloride channel homolog